MPADHLQETADHLQETADHLQETAWVAERRVGKRKAPFFSADAARLEAPARRVWAGVAAVARFAARPANQPWHPRAGSDGRTNPLGPLSESGRIPHAHRRAVGQFVSAARERSRDGPISRSEHVLMS